MKRNFVVVQVLVLLAFYSTSCFSTDKTKQPDYAVDFDLTGNKSKILLVSPTKGQILLDEYPLFPGLTKKEIGKNRAGVFFANGNVVVVVPNKEVTKEIKAWNDFNYLHDVIFINLDGKKLTTLFSKVDQFVSIVSDVNGKNAILAFCNNDSIDLIRMTDIGILSDPINYKYRVSYPDLITVKNESGKEIIVLDCMEDEEAIEVNWNARSISQLSFTKHE